MDYSLKMGLLCLLEGLFGKINNKICSNTYATSHLHKFNAKIK